MYLKTLKQGHVYRLSHLIHTPSQLQACACYTHSESYIHVPMQHPLDTHSHSSHANIENKKMFGAHSYVRANTHADHYFPVTAPLVHVSGVLSEHLLQFLHHNLVSFTSLPCITLLPMATSPVYLHQALYSSESQRQAALYLLTCDESHHTGLSGPG